MVDFIFTFDVVMIILLIRNNSFEIEKGGEGGGGVRIRVRKGRHVPPTKKMLCPWDLGYQIDC